MSINPEFLKARFILKKAGTLFLFGILLLGAGGATAIETGAKQVILIEFETGATDEAPPDDVNDQYHGYISAPYLIWQSSSQITQRILR